VIDSWTPATTEEVVSRFESELGLLDPRDRARLDAGRIEPRRVPVDFRPGESVVVVAEFSGRLLYWEDIEGGWELEEPSGSGGVGGGLANQFDLIHIAYQLKRIPPNPS
jgi:hypothetical protein